MATAAEEEGSGLKEAEFCGPQYHYSNYFVEKQKLLIYPPCIYPTINNRVQEVCADIFVTQYVYKAKSIYVQTMLACAEEMRQFNCLVMTEVMYTKYAVFLIDVNVEHTKTRRSIEHGEEMTWPKLNELPCYLENMVSKIKDELALLPCFKCGRVPRRHRVSCYGVPICDHVRWPKIQEIPP